MSDEKELPPSSCEFVLVGNITDALHSLFTLSGDAFDQVKDAIHLTDVEILVTLAFLPHHVLKFINNYIINKTFRRQHPVDFHDSHYLVAVCNIICQMGRLGLIIYAGELLLVFLSALGVPNLETAPKLLASFVYSAWIAKTFSSFSTTLLKRIFCRDCSQQTLLKRVSDSMIYLIITLLFLHANHVNVEMAITSLLTLGGVSSVVVGLALKDPLAEIVQGTLLLLTDKIRVGEVIQFQEKEAQVFNVEWMDTLLKSRDGSMLRIPHSQLSRVQLVNLSRMEQSLISQTITITSPLDEGKILQLLQDLQQEICRSCLKLVEQKVHVVDTTGTSITICIETHHEVSRLSSEYKDTRQDVILAIQRGIVAYKS